jgi:hypothetical protein
MLLVGSDASQFLVLLKHIRPLIRSIQYDDHHTTVHMALDMTLQHPDPWVLNLIPHQQPRWFIN